MEKENAHTELGGTSLHPSYVDAIKNDCKVCPATVGIPCLENGLPRRRPHGSRMVTPTGWYVENEEPS